VKKAIGSRGFWSVSSRIFVKLFAEMPNETGALRFENAVRVRIATFGRIKESGTKQYWKIPEWFEVCFSLQFDSGSELAFESILASLGVGWERHNISNEEQSGVWNPREGSTFFSPYVRWANVERFPESAIIPS
jgi:hypothetical protein